MNPNSPVPNSSLPQRAKKLMAAAVFPPQSARELCSWQHPLPLLPPTFPAWGRCLISFTLG